MTTNNQKKQIEQKSKGRVLVALSGGVDSSVALYLLKEQGYEVIGAHMKLWDFSEVGGEMKSDGRCCTLESIDDCRSLCDKIGAPFYVLNFVDRFREEVIENFVSEYRAGRTPNPCVICNTRLKWESFLKRARELGCDYMATGHYAQIKRYEETGRYYIVPGEDVTRDQSYALWGLTQDALAHTLLPVGDMEKSEVRKKAHAEKVRTANKPESQDICFVTDNNYNRFLTEWEQKRGRDFKSGDIVNEVGEKIGQHKGIEFYTLGQRKGLGIYYKEPVYVKEIDASKNQIVVSSADRLHECDLDVSEINWMAIERPIEPFTASVKIRYLHKATEALITPLDNETVRVTFKAKQRSVTPGQSAVFYRDNVVLGGGVISKVG